MSGELVNLLLLAGVPALAAFAGGALSLIHRPSSLVSSIAFGFAGGALVGTVLLEMVPRGVDLAGLWLAIAGFAAGFGAVYALDLLVHRGEVAGEEADQSPRVQASYERRPPRGGAAFVLAAAISIEHVAEGLTIGASLAVAPELALLVGLAVTLDNIGEGMAIGEAARGEAGSAAGARRRTLIWTASAGASIFIAAAVAWFALREMQDSVHGALIAGSGGLMLYLTLSDLLPAGQTRQYQQSSALAAGAAVVLILVVSNLISGR